MNTGGRKEYMHMAVCLSICLSTSYTHTHTHAHTYTRTHTHNTHTHVHTYTRTQVVQLFQDLQELASYILDVMRNHLMIFNLKSTKGIERIQKHVR